MIMWGSVYGFRFDRDGRMFGVVRFFPSERPNVSWGPPPWKPGDSHMLAPPIGARGPAVG